MDTLAHGLWTYTIFHKKKYVWLAVLFGVLPDVLSFGMFIIMNIITGNFSRGRPSLNSIPGWVYSSYNWTHSLVIFVLAFVLVYLISKKWYWPMAGWAIHILIDFPTHSTRFFPTPILWPISSFSFDGLSWATPWFMLLNYACLAAVFLLISYNRKKKK